MPISSSVNDGESHSENRMSESQKVLQQDVLRSIIGNSSMWKRTCYREQEIIQTPIRVPTTKRGGTLGVLKEGRRLWCYLEIKESALENTHICLYLYVCTYIENFWKDIQTVSSVSSGNWDLDGRRILSLNTFLCHLKKITFTVYIYYLTKKSTRLKNFEEQA